MQLQTKEVEENEISGPQHAFGAVLLLYVLQTQFFFSSTLLVSYCNVSLKNNVFVILLPQIKHPPSHTLSLAA
jgi:hypothetical protein